MQEYRPAPGLPADDLPGLLEANPGARLSIGSTPEQLQAQAERVIARGGNALSTFRLYNRNERGSGETRGLLLTADEWMRGETPDLPPRDGPA